MLTAENSAIDVSLRRYKKELSTSGGGYILFGVWSAIKVVMSVFIGELSVKKIVDIYEIEPEALADAGIEVMGSSMMPMQREADTVTLISFLIEIIDGLLVDKTLLDTT